MSPLRPRIWMADVECASADAWWNGHQAALQNLLPARGLTVPQTPSDLATLPFTTKADLHPPRFSVPDRELVRLHASSGTQGERTLVGYTAADLQLWSQVVARGLAAVGVHEDTVVYSALGHGLFTGGFGFTQAATALGALVVPGSQARSAVHVDLLHRIQPHVLFATPSYALHLARAHGRVPQIALGVFGAEPWTESDRAALQAAYAMQARDTYGLSEVIGPGVAFECPAMRGLHINADVFWPEVVDLSGAVVSDGGEGELVLTAPTKQALPLLRYRTGDLTRLDWSPCACGRTLPRMARVTSRVDEMVVVRGVNVRPGQVAAVLETVPHGAWQLQVTRGPTGLDEITLVVENGLPTGVLERVSDVLGLRLTLRPVFLLDHSGGKAQRLVDLRDGPPP
jgi:phenylacetate-CoA ligase